MKNEKEYIERGAALLAITGQPSELHYPSWYKGNIMEVPAADVVEVVHGEWVESSVLGSMLSECSVCHFDCGAYTFKYCPKCGAKMDGERKEE